MAARRLTSSTINWERLLNAVNEEQTAAIIALKGKSASYSARVAVLPKALPQINWSVYESQIKVSGMVAEFKKQYESLTVPYPLDTYSSKVDEDAKEHKLVLDKYVVETNAENEALKVELAKILSMIPAEDMTMEEFAEAYPEYVLDTFNNPTSWPHTAETQPDYLDKLVEEGAFDDH